LLIVHKIS